VSTKRGGWRRSRPPAIDDALPSQTALELVQLDMVESLEAEYFLRALAPLSDESHSDSAVLRAREAMRSEISKGWSEHETPQDRAYLARLHDQQRRPLAMCLEVHRLTSEHPDMTRPESVDAVASAFDCDTRTVTSACDEWLDSALFRQVLAQYRAVVQHRVTQKKS
jgi:hypothetical protein